LSIWVAGHNERERDRYRLSLWQSWHIALFTRQKRLSNLEHVLRRFDKRKPKRQSVAEMRNIVIAMNAAFGGTDRRKNG
jgi:hypothetical protein